MTNNQLTKEWLQNRIADMESTRDDIPFGFDESGNNELAAFKMALGAMDSEPVGYFGRFDPDDEDLIDQCSKNVKGAFPLYRHAQPAPVAPVCTCPSGDGSLRWPCPVHPGNSPVIGIDLASGPDRTVEVRYVAPPGYVMVPKEMTDEIGEAIAMQANCCGGIALDIYDAMLAAAPQEAK